VYRERRSPGELVDLGERSVYTFGKTREREEPPLPSGSNTTDRPLAATSQREGFVSFVYYVLFDWWIDLLI
jgi:hypothetical protein